MNKYNSLQFHYIKKNDDKIFFIFDYAKDGNLKKYVEKNGVLSEKEAIEFLKKMLDTIEFMQSKNILHLDIKPANVLLYKNDYVLSDFGASIKSKVAKSIHLKGNPIYIAPEYYYGTRNIKSEIYSLACSLYFILTAKHIFGLKNRYSLEQKIYSHFYTMPDLFLIKSNKLKYLLSKMLEKNYKKRIDIKEIRNILSNNDFYIIKDALKETKNIDFTNKYNIYKKMSQDLSPYAQNELAKIYLQKVDYKNAYKYFQLSANANFANGICNLALMHYNKKYSMLDYEKAFKYLSIASKQEHDKAQYFMGVFYENALACEINIPKAIHWYKKSAKNAYKKAYKKLKQFNIEIKY